MGLIQTTIQNIKDKIKGKIPPGESRSSKWPGVRANYLKDHPICEICGGVKSLQVHHKMPFHLNKTLELDKTNLITLCEAAGTNCHITFGHAGNFKGYNPTIGTDAPVWSQKFKQSDLTAKSKGVSNG